MLVKNLKTGEVEGMTFGPALEAVEAGTHEVVNEAADVAMPPVGDEARAEPGAVALDTMTKAELEAEAKTRGVTVHSGATKAEILTLLTA